MKIILSYTGWKLQKFSVIHILREINIGESRSSKTTVFALLGAQRLKICLNGT